MAEKAACEYAEKVGMELIRINPSIVLGPLLQPTMNFSTAHVLKYLTGEVQLTFKVVLIPIKIMLTLTL